MVREVVSYSQLGESGGVLPRGRVTFLFTDIADSTGLLSSLGGCTQPLGLPELASCI